MAHVQKQIRDAAVALLNVVKGDTTWRQAFGMAQEPDRDLLPYALVHFGDEAITPADIHNGAQERDSVLYVRARVRLVADGEALESTMDHVAAVAEATVTFAALNGQLGSNCLAWLNLIAVERDPEVETDEEREFAEVALQYQIRYSTAVGDPETLI